MKSDVTLYETMVFFSVQLDSSDFGSEIHWVFNMVWGVPQQQRKDDGKILSNTVGNQIYATLEFIIQNLVNNPFPVRPL